jgi:hypothetical protein
VDVDGDITILLLPGEVAITLPSARDGRLTPGRFVMKPLAIRRVHSGAVGMGHVGGSPPRPEPACPLLRSPPPDFGVGRRPLARSTGKERRRFSRDHTTTGHGAMAAAPPPGSGRLGIPGRPGHPAQDGGDTWGSGRGDVSPVPGTVASRVVAARFLLLYLCKYMRGAKCDTFPEISRPPGRS